MTQSTPTPTTLAAALAAAQRDLPTVIERDTRGHHGAYASLEAVLAATRPTLARHGIALTQLARWDADAGMLMIETRLLYGSEEIVSSWPAFGDEGNKRMARAQEAGKGATYARRYSILSILGCAAGDADPDSPPPAQGQQGQQGQQPPRNGQAAPPAKAPTKAPTNGQAKAQDDKNRTAPNAAEIERFKTRHSALKADVGAEKTRAIHKRAGFNARFEARWTLAQMSAVIDALVVESKGQRPATEEEVADATEAITSALNAEQISQVQADGLLNQIVEGAQIGLLERLIGEDLPALVEDFAAGLPV